MTLEKQILDELKPYISPINARVLLRRACQRIDLEPHAIQHKDLSRLIPAMQSGIRLFIAEEEQPRVQESLSRLHGGSTGFPKAQRIPITRERDIKAVRAVARGLCERMGATSFNLQRVVTAVSELARNIVSYTPGGDIRLAPRDGRAGATLTIEAADRGSGIDNLEEILSGRYRSKTGLGVGLKGVKRLAKTFDIETSSRGTIIRAEIAV